MKNIGIDDESLGKIVKLLKSFTEIEHAVIFGSRAKGNYKEASDIDIALFGVNVSHLTIGTLKLDYEELYLPWKLDLVNHSSIDNQELLDHIKRVGVPLF